MSDEAARAPAPRAGDLLLRDAPLARVEFATNDGSLVLAAGGRRVRFSGVRATNFLGPWDGTPGTVEWLRVASADAGELCLELRVRWREVPRVYRMVCTSVSVDDERARP